MDTTAGRGGASTAVRDGLIGRLVDGRYLVQSRIARGGMATVYLALDQRLDRSVALKVMHPGLADDEAFVARFQREAKAAARLTDPHVVPVYDQGDSDGLVYLAMEYVPGRTVRDVLREHGRLTAAQALTILEPVLQALVAAHRAGFVHRDIKPENVLIGDDGAVKVADFGLARAISAGNATTTHGVLIGTVAYLSPEQVERGIADARSDVYACGILLYEMLTGAVPYAGETPLAVAYQHVNAAVPRPSSVERTVPRQVDELVARATRHDPDERWQDAPAFLQAVRAARAALPPPQPLTVDLSDGATTLVVPLVGDRPTTPPDTAPTRASRRQRRAARKAAAAAQPRRRRRGWLVLVAILLAAAVVGGAGWWYGSARTVPVPAVVGKTLAQAQAMFAQSELTIEAGGQAYSESVSKGSIITTDPEPGSDAAVGTVVRATISAGPERFAVPELGGKTVAEARTALADSNLAAAKAVQREYDESIAQGRIIGTDPAVGTELRRGTPVTLVVSRGPEPIPVPSGLVGSSLADAKATLAKVGLTATSSEQYSMAQPAGRVISSSPASGKKLHRGDSVALVVSNGPPPVDVPSVRGMGESAAVAKLKSLGLVVKVNKPVLGYTPFGLVGGQSAVGRGALRKGDTITITVV